MNYEANKYRMTKDGGYHDAWISTPLRIYHDKCLFVTNTAWWIDGIGSNWFLINDDDGTINLACNARHSLFGFVLIISYT